MAEQFEFLQAFVTVKSRGVPEAVREIDKVVKATDKLKSAIAIKIGVDKASAEEAKNQIASIVKAMEAAKKVAETAFKVTGLKEAVEQAGELRKHLEAIAKLRGKTPSKTEPAPNPTEQAPPPAAPAASGGLFSRLFRPRGRLGILPISTQQAMQLGQDSLQLDKLRRQLERLQRIRDSFGTVLPPATEQQLKRLDGMIASLSKRIRNAQAFYTFARAVMAPVRALIQLAKAAANNREVVRIANALSAAGQKLSAAFQKIPAIMASVGTAIRRGLIIALLAAAPQINAVRLALLRLSGPLSKAGAGLANFFGKLRVPAITVWKAFGAALQLIGRALKSFTVGLGRATAGFASFLGRIGAGSAALIAFKVALFAIVGIPAMIVGGLLAAGIAVTAFAVKWAATFSWKTLKAAPELLIKSVQTVGRFFSASLRIVQNFNNYIRRVRFELLLAVNILGEQFREFALAASPTLLLGDTVNKIAEFDDRLTRTASNLKIFKAENIGLFERLGEEIRGAALGTRFLANDAADAVNTFAEAGFDVAQSIGALKPTLNLATAGFVSVEEAAEIAAGAVRQFGLSAVGVADTQRTLQKLNDIMVQAQLTGLSTVERLGETFKAGGPIAQVAGSTVEEFSALAVALSRVGVVGPEAGTAIRRGFQRIATAPKDFRDAIKALNIDLEDFVEKGGKFKPRGIIEFFKALRRSGADVETLTKIFGARSAQLAAIVDQAEELDFIMSQIEEATRSNISSKIAEQNAQSIRGVLDVARSAFVDLQIEVGKLFGPVLRGLASRIQQFSARAKEFIASADFQIALKLIRDRFVELRDAIWPVISAFLRFHAVATGLFIGGVTEIARMLAVWIDRLLGIQNLMNDPSNPVSTFVKTMGVAVLLATRGQLAIRSFINVLMGLASTVKNLVVDTGQLFYGLFARTLPPLVNDFADYLSAVLKKAFVNAYQEIAKRTSLLADVPREELNRLAIGVEYAKLVLEDGFKRAGQSAKDEFFNAFDDPFKPFRDSVKEVTSDAKAEFEELGRDIRERVARESRDKKLADTAKLLGLDDFVKNATGPAASAAHKLGEALEPIRGQVLSMLDAASKLPGTLREAAKAVASVPGNVAANPTRNRVIRNFEAPFAEVLPRSTFSEWMAFFRTNPVVRAPRKSASGQLPLGSLFGFPGLVRSTALPGPGARGVGRGLLGGLQAAGAGILGPLFRSTFGSTLSGALKAGGDSLRGIVPKLDPVFIDNLKGLFSSMGTAFMRGLAPKPGEPIDAAQRKAPEILDLGEVQRRLQVAGSVDLEKKTVEHLGAIRKDMNELNKKVKGGRPGESPVALMGP